MRLFGPSAALVVLAAALLPVACNAGPTSLGSAALKGSTGGSAPLGGSGGSGGTSATGGKLGGGGTSVIPPSGGGTGNVGEGGACAQAESQATLVKEPIDIVVALDNSGSMDEELDAVERNINVNFAEILDDSGVDYRVILISRHRKEARDASAEAKTSICVEAPLSGLAMCPSPAPVFSSHFFHYFTKIESDNSFDAILDTYAPPFASEFADRADQAPMGWSAWLRPTAKKVFLEMSDDTEDMSVADFVAGLQAEGPDDFGTDPLAPTFVFHSIIGVAEKANPTEPYQPSEPITSDQCPSVTSEGRTYQELSVLTGGLRFPLCGFDAYDVVFQRIAADVVTRVQVACDFDIPDPPAGKDLELEKVAVNYIAGDGSGEHEFLQARTPADCEPGAFYIENNTRIVLCPEACAVVQADENAHVDVLFTCESTIIVK